MLRFTIAGSGTISHCLFADLLKDPILSPNFAALPFQVSVSLIHSSSNSCPCMHRYGDVFQCKSTPQSHITPMEFTGKLGLISAELRAPSGGQHAIHVAYLPLMRIYLSSASKIIPNAFQITS